MNYVNSNSIKVYPSGYREGSYDAESFVNSEENLNSIAERLVSNKSYIVKDSAFPNIIFVCGGYLFKTSLTAIVQSIAVPEDNTEKVIYVGVKIKSAVDSKYKTLIPFNSDNVAILDTDNEFKGCYFDIANSIDDVPEDNESTGNYYLSLYIGIGSNNWETIPDSKLRFKTDIIQDSSSGECINNKITTNNIIVNQTGKINNLTVTSTTDSSSTTSGALKVSGGVGIAKKLNVGGAVTVDGNATFNGSTNTFDGEIEAGSIHVSGPLDADNEISAPSAEIGTLSTDGLYASDTSVEVYRWGDNESQDFSVTVDGDGVLTKVSLESDSETVSNDNNSNIFVSSITQNPNGSVVYERMPLPKANSTQYGTVKLSYSNGVLNITTND